MHPPVLRGQQQALPTQFLAEVVSADGKARAAGGSLRVADGPQLPAGQLGDQENPFTVPASGEAGHSWRVLVKPLSGGRHLVTAYSLDDLNSPVTRLEVADAMAGAAALVLLVGLGVPLVRASLAPLARIEVTAAAIAAATSPGASSTRRGTPGRAASRRAGHHARNDRGRVPGPRGRRGTRAGPQDRMRRFAADASHELRTPLTSVQGLAGYGLQLGDAASREELLRIMTLIQQEASRMGRLVADLLLLARFDSAAPWTADPSDLASIAAEAVQQARIVHPGRPITLHAAEPVVVYADDDRVRQVIDNLIGNAIQHTPDRSPVTVTVTGVPGRGQLTIADEGRA